MNQVGPSPTGQPSVPRASRARKTLPSRRLQNEGSKPSSGGDARTTVGSSAEERRLYPLRNLWGGAHPNPWVLILAVGLALVMVVPTAVDNSSAASSAAAGASAPVSTSGTVMLTGGSPNFPTPIHHVFVIYMENLELGEAAKTLPFERYLGETFSAASDYYSMCHPSASNYIAAVAGSTFTQCGSDDLHEGAYDSSNVGILAQNAGETWNAFMGSMPTACDTKNTSVYASSANPFLYFPDIVYNKTECDTHDVALTQWYSDVNASTSNPSAIPNYAFFTPNLLNNGHNDNHYIADTWLSVFLNTWFLDRAFMADSVIFITYDEGTLNVGYTADGVTMDGGAVPFYAVSPYTVGVHTFPNNPYTVNSSAISILSTTEWLLGLGTTGNYDNPTGYFPAMKGLFNFNDTQPFPPPLAYEWTNLTSQSPTAPSPRAQAAETYDAADGYILLFGGHNASASGDYSDTWTWQNGVWTQLHPATHPSSRRGASITYDPDCACVVLTGGSHSGTYLNDTWTYKGGVWTNITATLGASKMPPLRSASLVFDVQNNELVLFGGHQGAGLHISTYLFMNQTWLLPGSLSGAWTLLHPKGPSPGADAEAAMVWDPQIDAVLLTGGYDNFTILSFTWTFVNNTWTELLKAGPPTPRSGAAIAYDPALGGVVLFAGNDEDLYLNDVWLFTGKEVDGSLWTGLWAYPNPPHRAVGRGVYDPTTKQFVVFGGQFDESGNGGTGSYLNDTWAFQAASAQPPPYRLSGVVTSDVGAAISGATMFANVTGHHYVTTTNSSGGYAFSVDNGTFTVTATASGFLADGQSVVIAGQPVTGFNFQLSKPTASVYKVTGLVTNATSGAAIASATISYTIAGSPGSVQTGATGYFTAYMPNGTYTLSVSDSGYATQTKSVTVAGHDIDSGHFKLSTGSGTTGTTYKVTGLVTNSSSGKAIDSAKVSYTVGGTAGSVLSDSSGYFTALLPNGTYTLTVSASGYVTQTASVTVAGHDIDSGHFKLVAKLNIAGPEHSLAGAATYVSGGSIAARVERGISALPTSAPGHISLATSLTPNGSAPLAGHTTLVV
jgi:hypothetical protein